MIKLARKGLAGVYFCLRGECPDQQDMSTGNVQVSDVD